jgi:hypothetical protein
MATREERARNGRIGALEQWSREPDRTARTAPARRKSPITLQYWIDKIREEGIVPAADVHKAAEARHRAFQMRMSKRAAAAKRAKKAS